MKNNYVVAANRWRLVIVWLMSVALSAQAQTASNAVTLTPPTYDCQSGAIVFNTSGGDGSTITYNAPGISRANLTDDFGAVEPGLRNDPKPITISATQSGNTVTYTFDFGAFCTGTQPPVDPPTGDTLALLAPTYDCASGAITFRSTYLRSKLILSEKVQFLGKT